MKTVIKLELSVKLLLGAIALGLFLNAFKSFTPNANAVSYGISIRQLAEGINHITDKIDDQTEILLTELK